MRRAAAALQVVILVFTSVWIQRQDMSVIYHHIRGQEVIKLYARLRPTLLTLNSGPSTLKP